MKRCLCWGSSGKDSSSVLVKDPATGPCAPEERGEHYPLIASFFQQLPGSYFWTLYLQPHSVPIRKQGGTPHKECAWQEEQSIKGDRGLHLTNLSVSTGGK